MLIKISRKQYPTVGFIMYQYYMKKLHNTERFISKIWKIVPGEAAIFMDSSTIVRSFYRVMNKIRARRWQWETLCQ